MTSTNQVIRHTYKLEACLHACGHIGDQLHSYDSIISHISLSPFVPMWNTGPSRSSSIWFLLRLVLCLFPAFSSLLQYPFYCSFPGYSWSTPLPCTLRVLAQCVFVLGPGVAQWLRRCATSRTVQGSIPGGVTGSFSDIFPSDRTMGLGSTQPLVKMSTRNISWG